MGTTPRRASGTTRSAARRVVAAISGMALPKVASVTTTSSALMASAGVSAARKAAATSRVESFSP